MAFWYSVFMEAIQSSGYDPYADIRGAKKGTFLTDRVFGKVGESHALSFVESLLDGWVEVKTDGFDNGNLFIEVAHCPGRQVDEQGNFIWHKSGLNVTKAKYFMYLKQSPAGDLRSATIFETERLRRFHKWVKSTKGTDVHEGGLVGTGYMYANLGGTTPTIGLRIVAKDVETIKNSGQFD